MPVHDVSSALLFASRASDVTMTVVGGETVYREGASPLVDESRLRVRMAEIAEKVSSAERAQAGRS